MGVGNKRLSEEEFHRQLEDIRSWYPTGREVDLDEAVDYHHRMPEHRNMVKVHQRAQSEDRMATSGRLGEATLEQTLELALHTRDEGGADIIGIQPDTFTRRKQFDLAKSTLEESQRMGRSLLNGFPSVLYGVAACRRLYEAIDRPIRTANGSAWPQLQYLITLAAGGTTVIGGPTNGFGLEGLVPYDEAIQNYQQVYRLVGWYEERGVSIQAEVIGFPPGTVCPPSVIISGIIIDCLIAAEQGCQNFAPSYTLQICITQDVAALQVMWKLFEDYLKRFGYDVNMQKCANMWLGVMPRDYARTFAILSYNTIAAKWGGASRIVVKTVDEGLGLPSKEAQAASFRNVRETLSLLRQQIYPESKELELERQMIELEARSILDKVLEVGDGDVAVGAAKSLKIGVLDFPYNPNKNNFGRALAVRDMSGVVRFLDTGNLPFSPEIKEFHREKVAERMRLEGKKDYELMISDVTAPLKKLPVSHAVYHHD